MDLARLGISSQRRPYDCLVLVGAGRQRSPMAKVEIHPFDGDREVLRPLFRMADDSEHEIDRYLLDGEILTAVDEGTLVGHLQLVNGQSDGIVELKSMAVIDTRRGNGVGRALVEEAVRRSQSPGMLRLVVATAAADTGNLRFYQRLNFRMVRIERDAFGPEAGYADGTLIDGIPLRDRVWLERELYPACAAAAESDGLTSISFAARTSTCSMVGGWASSSGALAISAAAICPARCAWRPASSANASKMPKVEVRIRSANQTVVAGSAFANGRALFAGRQPPPLFQASLRVERATQRLP